MIKGFTLIEILMVVLIIGILGAIMLPQYQRAVLKSRYAALMPIAKSMADSNEAYYLEHGIYADDPQDLLIQGQSRYTDDTELEFGTVSDYAYVLAKNEDKIPNNTFVVYQKHSGEFPSEIHCEALANNDLAESVCKSFGGNESIGKTLTNGYETYVLFGTGNGVAPSGDNGGDEPEEPTCPDNSVCDEDGNVTGCASGYRLRNEVCETIPPCPTGSTCNEEGDVTGCATGYHSEGNACVETPPCPENAVCNEQGQVTGCSTGYVLNETVCEIDPQIAAAQAMADEKCQNTPPGCVGIVNADGTISVCEKYYASVNEEGECIPNKSGGSAYERVYDSNGNLKEVYACSSTNSSHECYSTVRSFYEGGSLYFTQKRTCSSSQIAINGMTCPNDSYNEQEQYTVDMYYQNNGRDVTAVHNCAIVNADGDCTLYSRMETLEWKNNVRKARYCLSISGTTCENDNYILYEAYNRKSGSARNIVGCYSNGTTSVHVSPFLNADGSCPSGYSWRQLSGESPSIYYKNCTSYDTINWETATCS